MFQHAMLGVLFTHHFIEMNFESKDLKFVQKKELPEELESRKALIAQMIDTICEKSGFEDKSKIDAYVLLPHEIFKVFTMLEMPNFNKLGKNKVFEALSLFTENTTNHRMSKPVYYFSTLRDDKKNFAPHYSSTLVEENDMKDYLELLFETGINLRLVGFEPDVIKRFSHVKDVIFPKQNTAFIHYFNDGLNDMIGFYVYMEEMLIGIRYLHEDSYEYQDIRTELNVIIENCRKEKPNLQIHEYCIFSKNSVFEKLEPYFSDVNLEHISERYLSTESLLTHHEPNFLKRLLIRGYRK